MRCQLTRHARARNGSAHGISKLPQLVSIHAGTGPAACRGARFNDIAPIAGPAIRIRARDGKPTTDPTGVARMKPLHSTAEPDRPDPDAELHARERLRILVALGSLLLGFVAALHW